MWEPAIILIKESNLAVQPHIRPRTVPSGGYLTERGRALASLPLSNVLSRPSLIP